jgi:hypothetical protein
VARFARDNTPGALTHIVSKFAESAPGFRSEREREAYLARVEASLSDSDWELLAYALMPDRIHWIAIAGESPLSRLIKPLHVGFALWLNRNQGHDGPVFADRPRTLESELADTLQTISWLHETPVREGFVSDAADSPWTSHRAYLGLQASPTWLRIGRALELGGMSNDEGGLARLAELMRNRPDKTDLMVRPSGAVRAALIDRAIPSPRRWDGDLGTILAAVSTITGVDAERIRSTERSRIVVGARRVAILAGTRCLGRTLSEMASVVAISTSSASRLVRTDPTTLARAAADAERVTELILRPVFESAGSSAEVAA